MHANAALRIADTRRLSPQTTSSSGYHSDLSLTNESPGSIHDNAPVHIEQYSSCQTRKKTSDNKLSKNKSLLQISHFLRKQYERAKAKLLSEKPHTRPIQTCTKATSTTPLFPSSEKYSAKCLASNYQQSSFIEPVHSVYVHPLSDNTLRKAPVKNYPSIQDCYSQQSSNRLVSYPKANHHQIHSHSFYRSAPKTNFENLTTGCCLSNNQNTRRHQYYSSKPTYRQDYYPYKYINKNYDYNRSLYAPLSDFISTTSSAFKPIQVSQHPSFEPILPSDDPCDLEVAQYFRHTPQWSNPNYFDIYRKEIPRTLPRRTYAETLC